MRDLSRCLLDDRLQLSLQVGTFVVDLLENIQSVNDDLELGVLLEGTLRHIEDKGNSLLIIRNVLHALELLLQLMKLRVELLGLRANGASSAATWSLRRGHPVAASSRSGCHLRVFVDLVELVDLVVNGVHGFVDVVELVGRGPGANSLLTVIKFTLQGKVSLVLLDKQVRFESLDLIWCLINIQEKLDVIAD